MVPLLLLFFTHSFDLGTFEKKNMSHDLFPHFVKTTVVEVLPAMKDGLLFASAVVFCALFSHALAGFVPSFP